MRQQSLRRLMGPQKRQLARAFASSLQGVMGRKKQQAFE
jgi:hypothetical protein